MARLGAKERAQLPDSAFAHIDARGRRLLPIHDAAHVRNALARFGQVAFEDEAARDRARGRLLRAAKKHGIMPIGFISAQLQPQRRLPKGHVTFLLCDIEGSTQLLARPRRRVRRAARRRPPPGAHRGARHPRPSRVGPRRRRVRGVRARARGARGRARDPAGDAGGRVAGRPRRAAAHRPAPRAPRADRDRLRRPLRPRRRAHLLRRPRRPDRALVRRAGRAPRSARGRRHAARPRALALPRPARARRGAPGRRRRPAGRASRPCARPSRA